MKTMLHYVRPLMWGSVLWLAACQEKEPFDPAPEAGAAVHGVTIGSRVRAGEPHDFVIYFEKPTPCQQLQETKVSAAGLTVNYNVILQAPADPCPAITSRQDSAHVAFTAPATGEYTLNFLLNNRLSVVRKVTVEP